jgi:hypothetical protein
MAAPDIRAWVYSEVDQDAELIAIGEQLAAALDAENAAYEHFDGDSSEEAEAAVEAARDATSDIVDEIEGLTAS